MFTPLITHDLDGAALAAPVNDARCNGSDRILHARKVGEYVALSLGNCSLIEHYVDDYNLDAGFVYTVAQRQKFRIPVSGEYSN